MYNSYKIQPVEKIISLLSYFSMGMVGFIWLIIAFRLKKQLRYFLRYNIIQSIIISIIFAVIKLITDILLSILVLIPSLDRIIATINWFLSIKVISIFYLSFNIFQLLLFILLSYISIGLLLGKIFYIPILSNIMNKVVKNYE